MPARIRFVGREAIMERLADHLSARARDRPAGAARREPGSESATPRRSSASRATSELARSRARGFEAEGRGVLAVDQILRPVIASTDRRVLLEAAGRGAADIAALVPEVPLESGGREPR